VNGETTRILLALLALSAMAFDASAQTPSVPKIDIVESGIYQSETKGQG
jgi:hypothetical protein